MTEIEKGNAFRALFLVRDFAQFLSEKRDQNEFMTAESSYALLFNSLSDNDIELLEAANVKFGMIFAPASQVVLPISNSVVNLICFEKHTLEKFTKKEVVAIILHEIGHVFNPNLEGDEHEFMADDYAVQRGYKDYIVSALSRGIENEIEGFNQEINRRRIERLTTE